MPSPRRRNPDEWAAVFMDEVVMPNCAPSYARDWFERGCCSNDPVVKFMMHWIAFNWLYRGCDKDGEKTKIIEFVNDNFLTLEHFNAFSTPDFEVFRERPVNGIYHQRVITYNREYNDLIGGCGRKKKVKSLFITIYHVRCNLFHGSKSLLIPGEVRLICAAANILEGYMAALLDENYLRQHYHRL